MDHGCGWNIEVFELLCLLRPHQTVSEEITNEAHPENQPKDRASWRSLNINELERDFLTARASALQTGGTSVTPVWFLSRSR